MGYQVVSRFLHRASGLYIDPGQECPPLSAEDVKRLVRARCLVEVPDDPPAAPPSISRKPRAPRQEASPPVRE